MLLALEIPEDGLFFFEKYSFFARLYLCRKMWMAFALFITGLKK